MCIRDSVCGYVRTVTPGNIPVSGVALNETSTSISVGNSEKLIATVTPCLLYTSRCV